MPKANNSVYAQNFLPKIQPEESVKPNDVGTIESSTHLSFLTETEGQLVIPHRLNQMIFRLCETKTEILVFACLVRFSWGFARSHARASKRFIAKWTGLDPSNVRRGLRGLQMRGLIKKLDLNLNDHFKSADHFELPLLNEFFTKKGSQSDWGQNDETSVNLTKDGVNMTGHNDENRGQTDLTPGVSLTPKKGNLETKEDLLIFKKEKLGPVALRYFQDLSEGSLFFAEFTNFEKLLRKNFNKTQIDLALLYTLKNGSLSGSACKCPMSYLLKAMEAVLEKAGQARASQQKQQNIETLRLEVAKIEESKKLEESEQDARNEAAFMRAYPDSTEQEKVIREINAKKHTWLAPSGKVARMMAISSWAKLNLKAAG